MAFVAPDREVDRVFLHCSATDQAAHDDVSVMRDWHVNGNGWSDVGYHYFIKKDGTLQAGRPLSRDPAAQAGNNRGTIAICLHGLAKERFTKAQFDTLIGLCREINQAYSGMITFHGHCEVSSKTCPVFAYREVLGLDRHGRPEFAPSNSPSGADAARAADSGEPTVRLMDRNDAVLRMQRLLNQGGQDVEEDGIFGQNSLLAVKAFQRQEGLEADGIVGARTWAALKRLPPAEEGTGESEAVPAPGIVTPVEPPEEEAVARPQTVESFTGAGRPLSEAGFKRVCETLGVGPAEVWSVLKVETKGFGFLDDRRPLILYERHIFHRRTNGRFDAGNGDISNASSGGYIGGKAEYPRLEKAMTLDRTMAFMSASWGIGQVMGFNHQVAGYDTVEAMVAAMVEDEEAQLLGMANFIKGNRLDGALRAHDWAGFARGYNGSAFAKNKYDVKLRDAFAGYQKKLPSIPLRSAQAALTYLGLKPGPVDGLDGSKTRTALSKFQKGKGLKDSGKLNEDTRKALMKEAFA